MSWAEPLEVLRVTMLGLPWEAVQAVAQGYGQERQGPARYHRAMAHIVSDYHAVCPIAKPAGQMAEAGGPVYIYSFTRHPRVLSSPKGMGDATWLRGALPVRDAGVHGGSQPHAHGGRGGAEPQGDALLGRAAKSPVAPYRLTGFARSG
ncbi:unnamed protein product [Lepidochelys olivacea]